ncbi:type II toxin-antitoxin system PemK/MazF family toxin [Capnocytophaga leadbetteri]|uniref:type II toxin-antitoxin system PemK/MazF family toxin n=1 Tax=Capnocytophaga leadbetteri TaxID=327575 RepID=UPI0028D1D638|nr:type II toxin-antitoxin system PemK/MazF family toxin [Capnocytophaga leadbetteri]
MKYQQGDIIEINFLFPNGEFKPHPALIISNDYFSYPLTDEMLSFKMSKQSYVKCHIISGNTTRDILRKIGYIKSPYFEEIKKKVIKAIF